jgi:Mg-chelatase subunit ChlD
LLEWAGNLELTKRRRYTPPKWLLLLLLLPLLFLLPWKCGTTNTAIPPDAQFVFRVPVETETFLLLVDKSASMEEHFPQVQAQVKQLLDNRLKNSAVKSHVDIINYDSTAKSALGSIKELTPEVNEDLCKCLNNLRAGGGTNLESAIKLAAEELKKHGNKDGKKATIVILTDGKDESIAPMLKEIRNGKNPFGSIRIITNTTSPRLLEKGSNTKPGDVWEKQLQEFSEKLGGNFGPQ